MKTVNKYKDILLNWFYLDGDVIRRSKDGYKGRYKAGDIVTPYKLCNHGYSGVHIPTTRTTVPYHHLLLLLKGIPIPDDDNIVIDHLDGNTDNNNSDNIRIVTQQLNCKNAKKPKNNTSGYTGITKVSNCNSYIVRKRINGKRVYLGCRKTLEEAVTLLNSYHDVLIADGYTERHGK